MAITNFMVNQHIHRMFICRYTELKELKKIKDLNEEEPFNIYMILKGKKIRLSKERTTIDEKGDITLAYEIHNKGEIEPKEVILRNNGLKSIDGIEVNIDYPFREFTITQNSEILTGGLIEVFLRNFRRQIIETNYSMMEPPEDDFEYLNLELLYVGQAKGREKESTALERLQSHSTLQDILGLETNKDPDSELYIGLIHFETLTNMITIPDSMKNPNDHGNPDIVGTIQKLSNSQELRNESINILEAGLIKYFQPPYNSNFKDVFPSTHHNSYKFFYDNNIHSIIIEFFPAEMTGARISTNKRDKYSMGIIPFLITGESGDMGALKMVMNNE